MNYVPMGMACKLLGLYETTVRRYAKEGFLKYERTPGGRYLIDVDSFTPPPRKGKDSADRETKRVSRVKYHAPKQTNPDLIRQRYLDHCREMKRAEYADQPCILELVGQRTQPGSVASRTLAYEKGGECLRTGSGCEEI